MNDTIGASAKDRQGGRRHRPGEAWPSPTRSDKMTPMPRSGEIRARAREAAEEVQRQAIAETTCEVIAAEGVEGASLRRIAEALGSTTGLISHYFATKDELLVRALEYAYQQLAGDPAAAAAPTLDSLLDGFSATLAPTVTARQF